MAYKQTNDVVVLMVDAADIAKSDSALNAAYPTLLPGTIIHDAGYQTARQKGLDGSWTTL